MRMRNNALSFMSAHILASPRFFKRTPFSCYINPFFIPYFIKFQKAVIIIVACEHYPRALSTRSAWCPIYPTTKSLLSPFGFDVKMHDVWELKRNTKIIIQRTHLFKPYLYQKILLQKLRIYSVLHQRIHPEIIIEARTKICRHRYIYRMTLDSAMSCFYSVGKEKIETFESVFDFFRY